MDTGIARRLRNFRRQSNFWEARNLRGVASVGLTVEIVRLPSTFILSSFLIYHGLCRRVNA